MVIRLLGLSQTKQQSYERRQNHIINNTLPEINEKNVLIGNPYLRFELQMDSTRLSHSHFSHSQSSQPIKRQLKHWDFSCWHHMTLTSCNASTQLHIFTLQWSWGRLEFNQADHHHSLLFVAGNTASLILIAKQHWTSISYSSGPTLNYNSRYSWLAVKSPKDNDQMFHHQMDHMSIPQPRTNLFQSDRATLLDGDRACQMMWTTCDTCPGPKYFQKAIELMLKFKLSSATCIYHLYTTIWLPGKVEFTTIQKLHHMMHRSPFAILSSALDWRNKKNKCSFFGKQLQRMILIVPEIPKLSLSTCRDVQPAIEPFLLNRVLK